MDAYVPTSFWHLWGQLVAQCPDWPQYMQRLLSRRLFFSASSMGPLFRDRLATDRSIGPGAVLEEVDGVGSEGVIEGF